MGCSVSSPGDPGVEVARVGKDDVPPETAWNPNVAEDVKERAVQFKKCGKVMVTEFTEYKKGLLSGNLLDGAPHGYGVYVMPNGDQYEGEYFKGEMNGWGKYTYGNGDLYEGQWKEGANCGVGKYRFSQNGEYTGYFKKGQMSGFGSFKLSGGGDHVGYWEHGQCSGRGACTSEGKHYEGDWKNGRESGIGLYATEDNVYYGYWSGGLKDGHGVMDVISPLNTTRYLCVYELGYRKKMLPVESDEAIEMTLDPLWRGLLVDAEEALAEVGRQPSKELHKRQLEVLKMFDDEALCFEERVLVAAITQKKHAGDAPVLSEADKLRQQLEEMVDVNEKLKTRYNSLKTEMERLRGIAEENETLNKRILTLKQQRGSKVDADDNPSPPSSSASSPSVKSLSSRSSSRFRGIGKMSLRSAKSYSLPDFTPARKTKTRVQKHIYAPLKTSPFVTALRTSRQQNEASTAKTLETDVALRVLAYPKYLFLANQHINIPGSPVPTTSLSKALEARHRLEVVEMNVQNFESSSEEKRDHEKMKTICNTMVDNLKAKLEVESQLRAGVRAKLLLLDAEFTRDFELVHDAGQRLLGEVAKEIEELEEQQGSEASDNSVHKDLFQNEVAELDAHRLDIEACLLEDKMAFKRVRSELRDLLGHVRVAVWVGKDAKVAWEKGDMAATCHDRTLKADRVVFQEVDSMEDHTVFASYAQDGYDVTYLAMGLEAVFGEGGSISCIVSALRPLFTPGSQSECRMSVVELDLPGSPATLVAETPVGDYEGQFLPLLSGAVSRRKSPRSQLLMRVTAYAFNTAEKMHKHGSFTICDIPDVTPDVVRTVRNEEREDTALKRVLRPCFGGKNRVYACVGIGAELDHTTAMQRMDLVENLRAVRNIPMQNLHTLQVHEVVAQIDALQKGKDGVKDS